MKTKSLTRRERVKANYLESCIDIHEAQIFMIEAILTARKRKISFTEIDNRLGLFACGQNNSDLYRDVLKDIKKEKIVK